MADQAQRGFAFVVECAGVSAKCSDPQYGLQRRWRRFGSAQSDRAQRALAQAWHRRAHNLPFQWKLDGADAVVGGHRYRRFRHSGNAQLALAGHSLKVIAVPINRLEPFFVVRTNIKTPADLKGKKITISRFGSGSDIMTRVALRYWKLDPDKDVSFFQSGNTPTRTAALIAGHMDGALVSSTGVAKIVATGCCRVLADLAELPLEFANYGVVVSGTLLKNQRDNVKRFLQALIEGIYTFKTKPDTARAVLRESSGDADVTLLYERLSKSFRDFPSPETRGIQHVIDSLPMPKARGAKAEDFIDGSLMEEIRKGGFVDKLFGKAG
jgi:ABC-type nitrate/sulfonate/bicarbonate transport system substrate-binding protein